jgi:hypothetical protein
MTNYNLEWLKGYDMTDKEHAEAIGVKVPSELFGTPEYNTFVLNKIYEENVRDFQRVVDPKTGTPMTEEEAVKQALNLRSHAEANINDLITKGRK